MASERKPTTAEKATLDATLFPAWVDRSQIKMVTSTGIDGKSETAPSLSQELPPHLRRAKLLSVLTPPTFRVNRQSVTKRTMRRVRELCAEEWMRRKLTAEDVGATITIPGGAGEKTFWTVRAPGWLRVRYCVAPDGRTILVFNTSQGAAVLEPDMELYEAHLEKAATK